MDEIKLKKLIDSVAYIENVTAIGKSGELDLPADRDADIDLYIFCRHIPSFMKRKLAVEVSGVADKTEYGKFGGVFWGTVDFAECDGVEIYLMYFTEKQINDEINSVLRGERREKEDGYFYPTGRCAAMLSMHPFYEKNGYITGMKELLSVYPEELSLELFNYHIRKANDREDFKRAVSRGDVLFYHATLEAAIDHFLQALFALNKCFFPSRKRTPEYIESFETQPVECMERLYRVIELSAKPESLRDSYIIWLGLYEELRGVRECMS
jgi:hypothetical protein